MTRILIMSAGAGAGHNRAAEALQASADTFFSDVESEWVDSLRFKSRLFRTFYADSYLFMANYSPSLWGFLYKAMGKKADRRRLDRLVKTYDRVAYTRLMEAVNAFAADAVLCTHFLPANVITAHGKEVPVYVVVTDFDVHTFWVNRKASAYFVASDEVRWQMRHYKYPLEKVHVTGIPVHPAFRARRGRDVVRRELGIRGETPVILFMSGGFGVGDMGPTVKRILSLDADFQLVVICGRNESARKKLAPLARSSGGRLTVHGFVNNVHDHMEAADLAITKAGGLSVSECLARSLPMIIFAPIPGQEERNCDFLMERGAALKAKGPEVIDFKIKELLEAPKRLAKMREAAAAAARPDAAREIIARVLQDLP